MHQRNITYNNVLRVTSSEILLNRASSFIHTAVPNSLARFSRRIHLRGARNFCTSKKMKYCAHRVIVIAWNIASLRFDEHYKCICRVSFAYRLIRACTREISEFSLIKTTRHEITFFLSSFQDWIFHFIAECIVSHRKILKILKTRGIISIACRQCGAASKDVLYFFMIKMIYFNNSSVCI